MRIAAVAAIVAAAWTISAADHDAPGFSFSEVARAAGLDQFTVYGGARTNRYLLETTGCGVAALDIDGDGWLDLFLVNGTTLDGSASQKKPPICHLYRNRRNGTFEDVTARAGVGQSGWGQGACAADYDNDGHDDLFVTSWGRNHLYRNRGDGTFEDVTAHAGLTSATRRWGAGCAFVDYDRDGNLDLLAANYIDFDLANAPVPESGLCRYKGVPVACGPPGLHGGKNVLYHNRGDGTFDEVAAQFGPALTEERVSRGLAVGDLDDDGRLDVVVGDLDGAPQVLHNEGEGAGNWLLVKLKGKGRMTDAIGAVVTVKAGRLTMMRLVQSGTSYLSQEDMRRHFGLGPETRAALLEVLWPDGTTTRLENGKADRLVEIRQK